MVYEKISCKLDGLPVDTHERHALLLCIGSSSFCGSHSFCLMQENVLPIVAYLCKTNDSDGPCSRKD